MRRVRRLIVLIIGVGLLIVGPPQAGAAEIAPEVERCLAASDKLSVVLMVDGSQSLLNSDPEDQRVEGIKVVLAALERLASDESSDKEVEVEVLLASFFGDSNPKPDDTEGGRRWTALSTEELGSLLEEADEYVNRRTGVNTDYALALDNAKKLLDQRAAERVGQDGGDPPCNLIVFFTDGELEITQRGNPDSKLPTEVFYAPGLDLSAPGTQDRVMKRAEEFLCDPGGLVDQLNGQGTVLLTVALSDSDAPIDTTLIEEISGQRSGCGTKPSLADYVEGVAGARLLFDFSDSLTGTSPPRKKLPPCAGGDCLGGGRDFTTLEGESGFKLLATTGSSEDGIRFVSPSGDLIEIEAGDSSEVEESGVRFEPRWFSETTIDLVAEFDTESTEWIGEWNVALNTSRRGERGALHSLAFQADLRPVLTQGDVLTRGEDNQVVVQLEDAEGQALDPADPTEVIGLLSPKAELTGGSTGDRSLDVEGPNSDLELEIPVEVPIGETSTELQLDLSLEFSGTEGRDIDPIRESFIYSVKLPENLGYPDIETGNLSLPSITGKGSSTGKIKVRGTAGDDGCIWFSGSRVASGPEAAQPVKVTTRPKLPNQSKCLKVPEGTTRVIEVVVTPRGEASGAIDLKLGFGLGSALRPDRAQNSTVNASLIVAKEPNVPARILILLLLVLLGAALPILLLHLLNRASATLSSPQGLLHLTERIEFDQGQMRVLDDLDQAGPELEASYESFTLVSTSGVEKRVRELKIGTLDFRTIASFSNSPRVRSLLAGPVGVVSSSAGRKVVAGARTSLRSWEENRWHEVPLNLPGTWVFEVEQVGESSEEDFLADSDGTEARVRGSLTLLISYGRGPEQCEELLAAAIRKFEEIDWKNVSMDRADDEEEKERGFLGPLRARFSRGNKKPGPEARSDGGKSEAAQESSNTDDGDSWFDDDEW